MRNLHFCSRLTVFINIFNKFRLDIGAENFPDERQIVAGTFLAQRRYLLIHPLRSRPAARQIVFSSRRASGVGNDEERVRMNVTPAERRGFRAKTTSRTPLAWLLFLFALSSPSLHPSSLPLLPAFPRLPSNRGIHLTHDSPLRGVAGRAFSRSSSPYPFSVDARRRRLSTTSRGTSLGAHEWSVRGGCDARKKSGSINEIVRAVRTPAERPNGPGRTVPRYPARLAIRHESRRVSLIQP